MDKELEQQAIQTFATVPEIYQQAFREAGADFPDELVGKIKKDPNQAVSILESDKNLKSAVINIYKQNKDAILQYMQQNSSMFREGGKFDYLMRLQAGGVLINKNSINKTKILNQRNLKDLAQEQIDAFPIKNVVDDENGITFGELEGYGGKATPNKVFAILPPKYSIPTQNGFLGFGRFRDDFVNHDGGIPTTIHSGVRMQEGGRLTRKQMYEQSNTNKSFNRSQTNKAYRNARRAGLSRDAAMQAVIGQPTIEETTATIERPTLINEVSAPVGQAVASQETISARPTRNYDNVDFGSFNFGDAFNKARGYGLNEFTWNGNRYTTNLAIPALGPDGKNYSIADTLLQNRNISAPDWWISKQWEPATVLSGNGVNPWPAIHAREINPPLKREGGKLSKENEVNKKYIKDSEKAGQEASKKMTDLKNKHKAELKRIRKGQDGLKTYIQRKYDEASGPIRRGWNNFRQSAPGQVMIGLLPVQTNTITTDENGKQMYAASPMFGGAKQAPYQWLPSKSYIQSAKMRGTSMDDFLFNLKRNPKNVFKGKGKIKLNPAKEEVEEVVSKIYGEPIL